MGFLLRKIPLWLKPNPQPCWMAFLLASSASLIVLVLVVVLVLGLWYQFFVIKAVIDRANRYEFSR
jgi:hypothetical protein